MSGMLNLKKGVADTGDITRVVEAISTNGAISIPDRGEKTVYITKSSGGAYTVAAPTTTVHDGVRMTIISTTAQAHTVTFTTAGTNDAGTSTDVGTFGGAKGDGVTVEAYQGDWWVVSKINVTFA